MILSFFAVGCVTRGIYAYILGPSNCQKHYSPDILREAMQKTVKHCLAQGELLHSAQLEFGSPILSTIRITFWAPDCSTLFVLQSGLYGSGTPLCTLVFLGQLLDSVLGE